MKLSLNEGRLGKLHSYFRNDYFAIPFKGSAKQKKSALKEYNKLLAQYVRQERIVHLANLKELLYKLQLEDAANKITSVKFWWEITPKSAVDDMYESAKLAVKTVSRLINWEKKSYGATTTYSNAECKEWVEHEITALSTVLS